MMSRKYLLTLVLILCCVFLVGCNNNTNHKSSNNTTISSNTPSEDTGLPGFICEIANEGPKVILNESEFELDKNAASDSVSYIWLADDGERLGNLTFSSEQSKLNERSSYYLTLSANGIKKMFQYTDSEMQDAFKFLYSNQDIPNNSIYQDGVACFTYKGQQLYIQTSNVNFDHTTQIIIFRQT